MAEKRTRLRKAVNYVKISGGNFHDSDDDFEAVSPPTKLKKLSQAKTEPKLSLVSECKTSKRPAVSDRVFERDLREAMVKSKPCNIEDGDDDFKNNSSKRKKKELNQNLSPLSPSDKTIKIIKSPHIIKNINTKSTQRVTEINPTENEHTQASPEALKPIPNANIPEPSLEVDDSLKIAIPTYKLDDKIKSPAMIENKSKSLVVNGPISSKPNTRKAVVIKTKDPIEKQNNTISKKKELRNSKLTGDLVISTDLLCHVKPVNIPSVGLRVGLSRKKSVKPLHPNIKPIQS